MNVIYIIGNLGSLAVIAALGYKAYMWLDAKIEETFKRNLQEAILTGLNFSLNRYRDAQEGEILDISTKPYVLGSVMAYVKMAVPDALKKLGMYSIDDDKEARMRLQTIIEARLEPWMFTKVEKPVAKEPEETEEKADVIH